MSQPQVSGYGTWKSPISSTMLAEGAIGLVNVKVKGGYVYWIEARANEKGRRVIVRQSVAAGSSPADVLPQGFNARSRVHEYGGGDYDVTESGLVVFAQADDQRVYLMSDAAAKPVAITPEIKGAVLRFSDFEIDAKNNRVFAVCEDHRKDHHNPENYIVCIGLDGKSLVTVEQGHDFFSCPRISPDGSKLAYVAWDHPNMSWDATSLFVRELKSDGTFGALSQKAGGDAKKPESVLQPVWSPEGELFFVSDRSNWWNIYGSVDVKDQKDEKTSGSEIVFAADYEFAGPDWVFANKNYAFVDSNTIIADHSSEKGNAMSIIDIKAKTATLLDLPFTFLDSVNVSNGVAYFLGSSSSIPLAVFAYDIKTKTTRQIKTSVAFDVSTLNGYLSAPELVQFPTEKNQTAFGFFYPPANKDYKALPGELPPVLVSIHGGPTGTAYTRFMFEVQFWTSRGFAFFDVNYGGSTGYGRTYRERLNGNWGVMDLDDCCNGVTYLIKQRKVCAKRAVISGRSAGGFTVLAALTFRNVFAAGVSHYGVSDLEVLAKETHKFEARYLDKLIAPYPEGKAIYQARSPLSAVDKLKTPVAFFHGLDDMVVPPNQAVLMYESAKKKGVPVALTLFPGEGHGFRQAATRRTAFDGELYFYSKVLGFTPADVSTPPPISMENLPYKWENETRGFLAVGTIVGFFTILSKFMGKN